MFRLLLSIACTASLFLGTLACAEEELDLGAKLPDDTKIARRGTLPNGMRYWIRPHEDPKGAVDLTMFVRAGSLHEEDDQLGYAHFVEHMAFNGTKHFPPGEVQRYFASVGIDVGHHSNAFTGPDGTEYTMLLRDTSPKGLRRALQLFSDFAQHVTFQPAEVEQERKVVLEELRLRQDQEYRRVKSSRDEILSGSRLAARDPLGTVASVRGATPEGLRDYYERWYRPDRATLLVVGDVRPEVIEPLIAEAFGGWARPEGPVREISPGPWPESDLRVVVLSDKEWQVANVGCFWLRERPPHETVGDLRARYVEQMAVALMNWRGRRVHGIDRQLMSAPALYEEVPGTGVQVLSWRSGTRDSTWAAALEALLMELRRVEVHGFGESEFEQAHAAMMGLTESADRRTASEIGQSLLNYLEADVRPLDRAEMLALSDRLFATITAEECADAIRRLCDPRRGTIKIMLGALRPEWLAAAKTQAREIVTAVAKADVRPLEPPPPPKPGTPRVVAAEPKPGAIRSRTHHEALDVTTWTLANGARVHLKRLPTGEDVHVAATLLGGRPRETAANRGITAVVEAALQPPRLTVEGWDCADIPRFLAARGLSFDATASNHGLVLSLDAQRGRLPDALSWLRRVLTDAELDDLALLRECKEMVGWDVRSTIEDASAVAWTYLVWHMSGKDPRATTPTPQTLNGVTLEAAQAWMDRLMRAAPLEVAIYGDLEPDTLEPLIRTWVGSLPKRTEEAEALRDLWKMEAPPGPVTAKPEVVVGSETASVLLLWRGLPRDEVARGSALRHAATILTARLERTLREEHGVTYALRCDCGTTDYRSKEDAAAGGLFVEVTADPARADDVAGMAKEIVIALAKEGATAEELATCQKQWSTKLEVAEDTVGLWHSLLEDLRHDVRPLERYAPIYDAMKTVDGTLVTKTLREIVRDDRFFQVIALPRK